MGQLLLIASVALTLLAAVFGFLNHSKLASKSEELTATQSSLATQTQAATTAQAELKTTKETLEAATQAKEELTSKLATTQSELETQKSKEAETAQQIIAKEKEIADLTTQLKDAQDALDNLPKDGKGPAPSNADNSQEVAEKEAIIAKLQEDLDSSHSELEVLKKKEQVRSSKILSAGIQGRILAYNQAWNFVVVNLGDRNGIVSNAEMLIKRGTQLIGKVRITSVNPSTSIADIVANSVPSGITIQPGDDVISQSASD